MHRVRPECTVKLAAFQENLADKVLCLMKGMGIPGGSVETQLPDVGGDLLG
jgi:hypothetical protein